MKTAMKKHLCSEKAFKYSTKTITLSFMHHVTHQCVEFDLFYEK